MQVICLPDLGLPGISAVAEEIKICIKFLVNYYLCCYSDYNSYCNEIGVPDTEFLIEDCYTESISSQ